MIKQGMKPTHAGQILKEMYLEPLGLSQADAAANLGVARKTLSMLLNQHQGISAETALRLAKAFNTTPELWLNMQSNYDLWYAGQKVKLSQIKVFRMPKASVERAGANGGRTAAFFSFAVLIRPALKNLKKRHFKVGSWFNHAEPRHDQCENPAGRLEFRH